MPGSTPPMLPSRRAKSAESHGPGATATPQAPPSLADELAAFSEAELPPESEAAFWLFTAIPSGLLSLVIHLLLLIGLGVCVLATQYGAAALSIIVSQGDEPQEEELDATAIEIPLPEADSSDLLSDAAFWETAALDPGETLDVPAPPAAIDLAPAVAVAGDLGGGGALFVGTGAGRGEAIEDLRSRSRRRQQALRYGATPGSENAVELALQWILTHQREDGSWSFNHREGDHRCRGCLCSNPGGNQQALNAATAMGLLPLLGAGHTHRNGRYRREVAKGLKFLLYRQKSDGSLLEPGGRMYSHGLAALALCEAYAMTRDSGVHYAAANDDLRLMQNSPTLARQRAAGAEFTTAELRDGAQRAIRFIEYAQHSGGGWRYAPKQAGDTSVVGWQMMALKSGYLAGLDVKPETIKKAVKFLDHAADDQIGSTYGYTSGNRQKRAAPNQPAGATTAIGLLCRMYTGWERDREGLRQGVQHIRRTARPDRGLYFYYYATQVMHHHGGPPWDDWNNWMRDYLVSTQSDIGSEAGSWNFAGPHDSGRLYCTSLAAMTLEVYYRYSPIYSDDAVNADPAGE